MKPTAIIALALALAVAACGDNSPVLIDADPSPDTDWCGSSLFLSACNPVSQTGCNPGQKCTWQTVNESTGRIACVPTGTVPEGGACTFLPPGETEGYDDCVGGHYCNGGVCQRICTDAPDSCPFATSACSTYPGLFEDCASVSTGVCDFKCEPGPQTRLFDGAALCGSTPESPRGCYGQAWSIAPTEYVCMRDISDSQHGETPNPLSPEPLLNSCDAGYFPWVASYSPTAPDVCIAFCTPGETHAGAPANADGVAPFPCASRGAAGSTMECRYLHIFDVTPPREQYNASGICIETASYVSDWDDDPSTPSTPMPRCVDLGTQLIDTDGNGTPDTPEHQHWGCAPWVP